jgi:glycine/D-amino acid oxidase-like deaminating enzyme
MQRVAASLGVRMHENTGVTAVEPEGAGVRVTAEEGTVIARQAVVTTKAHVPLPDRLGPRVLPVHDHVLVTEPLDPAQLRSIGWRENQGLTEVGPRCHYYRRTPDDRILWGGLSPTRPLRDGGADDVERQDAGHRRLADAFFSTFPQLEGVRFSHRWAGITELVTPLAPRFGTAVEGRIAHATGLTGLDVAASRFAANTMLDLLGTAETLRTRLRMVRRPDS